MNIRQIKFQIGKLFFYFVLAYSAAAIFFRAKTAMSGVLSGLTLCYSTIIPSLFPFLVVSQLLLQSPVADYLGVALLPYTRLLGVRSRKAPSAVLCGMLGGFAIGAKSIDTLYKQHEITAQQAEQLLICTIGSSPAFITGSVGLTMLGNAKSGLFLLIAQLSASLLIGLCFRKKTPPNTRTVPVTQTKQTQSFTDVIAGAVTTTSLLCGYIAFFSFFTAILLPPDASPFAAFCTALLLEVTAACEAGAKVSIYCCCAALSAMGVCVFLQVRALLCKEISLKPLFLSRLLHFPLALLILHGLLRLFPISQTVATAEVITFRMPTDVICVVFILCALVFGGEKPLRFCTKRV